jgi:large subunit ribosomal protein L10
VSKSKKQNFISELEDIYKTSNSVIVTHYHGLTVAEVTKLRAKLRESGASFKVVKNTLSKIAATNVGMSVESGAFAGPTAIAYSVDPVAAAKGVVEFAKANDNLKIICGIVDDKFLDVSAIEQLAKLPSLDELRGKIVGVLQAPAANLARVVQAPAGALARVLQAYADKK